MCMMPPPLNIIPWLFSPVHSFYLNQSKPGAVVLSIAGTMSDLMMGTYSPLLPFLPFFLSFLPFFCHFCQFFDIFFDNFLTIFAI